MEHLSEFQSNLKTVRYFLMCNNGLTENDKIESSQILTEINHKVLEHLGNKEYVIADLDQIINKVYTFVLDKDETMSRSLRDKVFRFMRDVHRSIENLHAIHTHRTPISLKAYCKVFIYIFPLLYAPTIIYNLGPENAVWPSYFIVILTEFILISLYNVQDHLEYPFDNVGMDDIQLENFKIER